MASQKVTENKCRKLKCPEGKRQFDLRIGDPAGLILRVTKTGHKSWVYRFTATDEMRDTGKRVEMKFGDYGTPAEGRFGLVDAKLQVAKLAADVRAGNDPRVEQNIMGLVVEPRSGRGPRVRDCWQIWVKHKAPGNAVNSRLKDNGLYKRTYQWVKDSHVDSFQRKHVTKWIQAMENEGKTPNTIRNHIQLIGKICSYAQDRGEDFSNVFSRFRYKTPKPRRSRTLTNNELRLLWNMDFGACNMNTLLRFILLTGNRKTETMLARWSDIDLNKREWTLPAQHVKTRNAHTIPFDSWLHELLVEHRETYGDVWKLKNPGKTFEFAKIKQGRVSDFVFPFYASEHFRYADNEKAYQGIQVTLAYYLETRLGLTRGQKTGTGFTVHDLRRTVGTRLKRIRVDGEKLHGDTVRATLNHREGHGVTEQHYAPFDPQDAWPEHKQGLELWSQELRSIVEPDPTGGAKQKPKLTLLKRTA